MREHASSRTLVHNTNTDITLTTMLSKSADHRSRTIQEFADFIAEDTIVTNLHLELGGHWLGASQTVPSLKQVDVDVILAAFEKNTTVKSLTLSGSFLNPNLVKGILELQENKTLSPSSPSKL